MVDGMLKSKSQLIYRCNASESDCSPVHHAQVTSWILMSHQPPRVTSGQLHSVTSGRITHNNDREFTERFRRLKVLYNLKTYNAQIPRTIQIDGI